jgi:copper chaperone
MEKTILNVHGMSCSHCERAIKNALNELEGVSDVKVNLNNKTVTVEFDNSKVTIEKLKETIIDTGYEVK